MLIFANPGQRAQKAIVVKSGGDRFDAAMTLAGWRFECKLSGRDTGGDYCVYDTIRTVKGGPPLHIHREQDEWFYVRSGEFLFRVADEAFQLKAGDTLFGPRGVPHTFAALTDSSSLIVAFQPAGAIEELFAAASALNKSRQLSVEDWQNLAAPYGVEIVGPPLAID